MVILSFKAYCWQLWYAYNSDKSMKLLYLSDMIRIYIYIYIVSMAPLVRQQGDIHILTACRLAFFSPGGFVLSKHFHHREKRTVLC